MEPSLQLLEITLLIIHSPDLKLLTPSLGQHHPEDLKHSLICLLCTNIGQGNKIVAFISSLIGAEWLQGQNLTRGMSAEFQ